MNFYYNIAVPEWVVEKYKLSLTDTNDLIVKTFATILYHVVAIRQANDTSKQFYQ